VDASSSESIEASEVDSALDINTFTFYGGSHPFFLEKKERCTNELFFDYHKQLWKPMLIRHLIYIEK